MLSLSSVIALTLALSVVVRGTQYSLVKEYAGEHFFDEWDFYGHCELQIWSALVFFAPAQAAHHT